MSKTPLEAITPQLFLKREDLLPFGGGSKIRRFCHWAKTNPQKNLSVFSDAGSHTFFSLSNMLERGHFDKLTFYERSGPKNPYQSYIQKKYSSQEKITVKSGPFSLLQYYLQKLKGFALLGIGGSIPSSSVVYKESLQECLDQLLQLGLEKKEICHIFPIASGNMADGFIELLEEKKLFSHKIIAVMTGHFSSYLWLPLKYLIPRSPD